MQAGRNGGGVLDGPGAGNHQVDQQEKREEQIAPFQQGKEFGQIFLIQTLQPQLFCLKMDGNENTCKIQNSRKNGAQYNSAVGLLDIFRH